MRTYNSTPTIDITYQKKWVSANRDASGIIDKKRTNALGVSLNPSSQEMSYMTKNNTNTIRNATKRVRSSGSVVPAKKIHQGDYQPIFY